MHRAGLSFLAIFSLISRALAVGEITVLHSPAGVQFSSSSAVKASELANVITAALGHSVNSDRAWNTLTITNPFAFPKVAAVVLVDGVSTLRLEGQFVPLKINTELDVVEEALSSKLAERGSSLSTVVGQARNHHLGLKLRNLDASREVDATFLHDISLLSDAADQKGNFWLRLRGLHGLVDVYGFESAEVTEALELLKAALDKLEKELEASHGDEFLLLAIASDESHTRRSRQILEARESNNTFGHLNVSQRYTENYASIFNIILWMSVFLIAALISTSVFICTMDPGRDSIIYRMTTQRMKKEN